MSDKLQQIIDENRGAFDSQEPSPELWNRLRSKLKQEKRNGFQPRKLFMWAASFAAVAILSITVYSLFQNKSTLPATEGTTAGDQTEIIDLIDPIQARQISQFEEIIELKQSELKRLQKEQPELYREFISDINSLDSAYTALKSQLPDNPNREILLETMIQNLQLQSELLSRHLKIIKELKQPTKRHEKQII